MIEEIENLEMLSCERYSKMNFKNILYDLNKHIYRNRYKPELCNEHLCINIHKNIIFTNIDFGYILDLLDHNIVYEELPDARKNMFRYITYEPNCDYSEEAKSNLKKHNLNCKFNINGNMNSIYVPDEFIARAYVVELYWRHKDLLTFIKCYNRKSMKKVLRRLIGIAFGRYTYDRSYYVNYKLLRGARLYREFKSYSMIDKNVLSKF